MYVYAPFGTSAFSMLSVNKTKKKSTQTKAVLLGATFTKGDGVQLERLFFNYATLSCQQ